MAAEPTDKKGNKVKFIRKNGKVIPIKAKGPGGGDNKTKKRKLKPGAKKKVSALNKSINKDVKESKKQSRKSKAGGARKKRGLFMAAAGGALAIATKGKSRAFGKGFAVGGAAIAGVGALQETLANKKSQKSFGSAVKKAGTRQRIKRHRSNQQGF